MRKGILVVFLAVVLVVSMVGFGACEAPAPPTPPEEPEEVVWEWPRTLAITTSHLGGGLHMVASSWGAALEEQTGMKVRALAQASMPTSTIWTQQGTVDFYTPAEVDLAQQIEGIAGYATRDGGPFDLRTLWLNQNIGIGYPVRGDSGITIPQDLKGKTIGIPTGAPSWVMMCDALLAWGDLTRDDVTVVEFTGIADAHRAVMDGTVDTTLSLPGIPVAFEVEGSPHGQGWIELDPVADPEGAQRYMGVYPMAAFGPNQLGVESSAGITTLMLYFPISTRADTDPELVYNLCKWLDENFDVYKDVYVTCQTIHRDNYRAFLDANPFPVHEGAIKYLKEIGMWDEVDEAQNQAAIELLNSYVDAYQEAITMADDAGIYVDPTSDEWVELWEGHKQELGLSPYTMIVR